jgi:hypothetical protein
MPTTCVVRVAELEERKRLDAEFYQPTYVEQRRHLRSLETNLLGKVSFITDGQHGYHIVDPESPIRHITAKCVSDGLIWDEEADRLSAVTHNKNLRSALSVNDLLITTAGTIGNCGLVPEKILPANIDQDVARVHVRNPGQISPFYVLAFLSSDYGQIQIRLNVTGQDRQHITLQRIRRLRIPVLGEQRSVDKLVSESVSHQLQSKEIYKKAEDMLLTELGVADFAPKYERYYTANLSEAFRVHRADAEYFDPVYDRIIQRLWNKDSCSIREIEQFNRRGVQPNYVEEGDARVITSKHLGRTDLEYENLDATTLEEWDKNADAQVKKFDILIYTTGAYVGRTNCYLENDKALASNHINILRVKALNPIYAAVFLNSPLGQIQVRRWVSGSAQSELYPRDISRFVIWRAPSSTQEQIASLALESHDARKRGRELLLTAIREVEASVTSKQEICGS